jgi:hypothetical protein
MRVKGAVNVANSCYFFATVIVVFTACLTRSYWTSGRKEVNFFSFPISSMPNTVNKEVLELFKAG